MSLSYNNNINIDFNLISRKRPRKVKTYCSNCGKYGHVYRKCLDPVTSLGIVSFKIDNDDELDNKLKNKYLKRDSKNCYIGNTRIPCSKISDIEFFCYNQNKIKFLLIRRKHTLGFMEFIRGRYNTNDIASITSLFEQMTKSEISKINTDKNYFTTLWQNLWSSSCNKSYDYEFESAERRFNKLRDDSSPDLDYYIRTIKPKWNQPEWGFPKGRRNHYEKNVDCAIREFQEESDFKQDDHTLLEKLNPIEEIFIGTNGVKYKHIYYISLANKNDPVINKNNRAQFNEIGDIGWFSYEEAIRLFRPYHIERKKLLTKLYLFILDNLIKLSKIELIEDSDSDEQILKEINEIEEKDYNNNITIQPTKYK